MTPALLIEGNHRILVIDDNRAIHDDLRKILIGDSDANSDLLSDETFLFNSIKPSVPATSFEIDSAYQGQEGLLRVREKLAAGSPYAMAFVDVRMPPGWDGMETIARLWEVDPNLQVVICTAYSDYSWGDIHTKLGQSDSLLILKKPFDNIEVIQLAHALTRKWVVSHQARARLEDLDLLVAQRTVDLQATTDSLEREFAARNKAEDAFRVVFEASPIGIALLNEELCFVSANDAMLDLHGLTRNDVIGDNPLQLEWFNSRDELVAILGAELRNAGVDQQQVWLKHAKLGRRFGLLWARNVEIRGHKHVLCFLLDITERKQIEEELKKARTEAEDAAKAKGEFLANMSHEIRTPLNGVLGLSSFLEDQTLPESIRDTGRLIRTSGEMLRRVLDDLLDLSKIESGKLEFEKEPFSLRESLDWSVGIYHKAALDKQLELNFTVGASVPDRLIGDATRLRQVLTNLISNAIKFTEVGSVQVSVGLDPKEGETGSCQLRVAVTDTGIGIPEDRLNRLFQAFSQVDASTNRRFGGTGLGLAISRRLVEMMGGQITVQSKSGTGTTFAFSVPFGISQLGAAPADKAEIRTTSRRILVVEDNAVNRVVAQRMLERMGHSVDLATEGAIAIRKVEETRYDLLLMDVNMPGLDGLETTRRIRNLPPPKAAVPIIALTASAMADDRRDCVEAGMNDYLSKPINVDALRVVIDRWASGPGSAPQTLVEQLSA